MQNKQAFTLIELLYPAPISRIETLRDDEARCSGFTLIELLIVVLIIGILAAVALPQYQAAVTKARVARLMPLLKNLRDAQETYYLANGKYALTFDELNIDIPTPKSITPASGNEGEWAHYKDYDIELLSHPGKLTYIYLTKPFTMFLGIYLANSPDDNCKARGGKLAITSNATGKKLIRSMGGTEISSTYFCLP